MAAESISKMKEAHEVLCEFPFTIKELDRGYSDRTLRIDLDKNEVTIHPVSQQMKDLWTGGKGFDLWLMFQEVDRGTRWDSPNNPICFSPGPLGGTTSFPGTGKTLVTAISPLTQSVIDCNVGGFFGPYFKFCGFDALVIVGKAKDETIIVIDGVKKKITIETAPRESIDSHLLAEELTEMYADNDLDKRNIAVVSSGRGAQHTRMGVLNFSFWDWRRRVPRLKQAGRGGIGTVFRDKKLKALVVKNRDITPAWRVHENKVASWVTPKKIYTQCASEIAEIDAIIEKWGRDPDYVIEMMQDIQDRFRHISNSALDRLEEKTGTPKAFLYHIATFDNFFTLEEKPPAAGEADKTPDEIKPSLKQQTIVFRNLGKIDPNNIDDYIGRGGYNTFKKVLEEKNPQGIIEEVKKSGIRGRSGGFPVGSKWESGCKARKERNSEIYILCSAGEADPRAYISRSIIENDPHSLIEGMLIGAYAVGAEQGFIIIRKEHALAEERLNRAIDAAREKGYLGENIQGSGFNFDLYLHRGAGAAVCGETTSLIATISGRAGESRAKHIPIEEYGFRANPTIVNNVETWVNIPVIMEKGAKWFAGVGTDGYTGTKVISLTGSVRSACLAEVPMGISLREIVEDIGGGVPDGRQLKAVQIGGPSGGCIPASLLGLKINFDSLIEAGAIIGSGSMTVMDEKTCMVDNARSSIGFLAGESCGKCTPCREGLYLLKNVLMRICSGDGKEDDIQFLEEIAKTIADTSLCQFGGSASNPVLSTLRYFKEEYQEHIKQKKCRSGVCKFNTQEVR